MTAPPLAYRDTAAILRRLGPAASRIVLVGGQAVNFWADYYLDRVDALAADAPFTSKDIDFLGSRASVKECAERLLVDPILPDVSDTGQNSGALYYVDEHGHRRVIQFLTRVFGGRTLDRTTATAVWFDLLADDGHAVGAFRVMHPLMALKSKAINTQAPLHRRDERSLKQLRAAIICAREYTRDLLDAGQQREALDLVEQLFKFVDKDRRGRDVARTTGIDPWHAVLVNHAGWPDAFRTRRFPQLCGWLAATRVRLARLVGGSGRRG